MSVRLIGFVTLAVVAGAVPSVAATDPYSGILNGPATRDEVNEANRTVGGCGTEDCAALLDVARAFMIILRRDVPGTMAHVPQPPDPARAADVALQRDMLAHRSRYPAYCAILTKLARHYADYFIGHASLELANRMDEARSRCTHEVNAALPDSPDVTAMVQDARETCETDRRKGCERDARRP